MISSASVSKAVIVPSMNSARGIARGSSLLFSNSVRTQGGITSSTRTGVFLNLNRSDCAYECNAAFVEQ